MPNYGALGNAVKADYLKVIENATVGGTLTVTGASTLSSTLTVAGAAQFNSTFTVGEDDSGYDVKLYGATASAFLLWDESDDALKLSGDARLDLSACTVKAGNTDGGVIKIGTSAAKVTEDTANMKFVSMYFDNGATSGDNRGMYLRLYLTGAGGGGEALRVFTTVENVAAGTAHGAHISLNFGTSGTVTGQGIAMRSTLHLPNTALSSNVTMSAVQAEIYSDGANSDPGGSTKLSFFRAINDGNTDGKADVDDDMYFFDIQGLTAGADHVYATSLTAGTVNAACTEALRILVGANVRYIPLATAIT